MMLLRHTFCSGQGFSDLIVCKWDIVDGKLKQYYYQTTRMKILKRLRAKFRILSKRGKVAETKSYMQYLGLNNEGQEIIVTKVMKMKKSILKQKVKDSKLYKEIKNNMLQYTELRETIIAIELVWIWKYSGFCYRTNSFVDDGRGSYEIDYLKLGICFD